LRSVGPHENSQAEYALFANQPNFQRGPLIEPGQQRDHSAVWEIDVADHDFGLVDNLLEDQRDFFQLRLKALILVPWQGREQPVGNWRIFCWRHRELLQKNDAFRKGKVCGNASRCRMRKAEKRIRLRANLKCPPFVMKEGTHSAA